MSPKPSPKQKNSPEEALRRELSAWSHEELVDFVMTHLWRDAAIRAQVEQKAAIRGDAGTAVAKLKAEIDRVLDIHFVEWKFVSAYMFQLESVLEAIASLGRTAPAAALEVTWYFVQELPGIFESVHDECELGMFCDELCETTLALTAQAERPFADTATRLLDAFLADDTCRFDDVPEHLVAACQAADRSWLLAELTRRLPGVDQYQATQMRNVIARLESKGKHPVRKKGKDRR